MSALMIPGTQEVLHWVGGSLPPPSPAPASNRSLLTSDDPIFARV